MFQLSLHKYGTITQQDIVLLYIILYPQLLDGYWLIEQLMEQQIVYFLLLESQQQLTHGEHFSSK